MNNYELDQAARDMAMGKTQYQLAKELILALEKIKQIEKQTPIGYVISSGEFTKNALIQKHVPDGSALYLSPPLAVPDQIMLAHVEARVALTGCMFYLAYFSENLCTTLFGAIKALDVSISMIPTIKESSTEEQK